MDKVGIGRYRAIKTCGELSLISEPDAGALHCPARSIASKGKAIPKFVHGLFNCAWVRNSPLRIEPPPLSPLWIDDFIYFNIIDVRYNFHLDYSTSLMHFTNIHLAAL